MSESLKSDYDRTNLQDVPSYQKVFDKIREFTPNNNASLWKKPAILIMALTGARIGEILLLKKRDIKFYGYHKRELHGDFTFADVASVQFNLFTEKNRKNKYRIVPVIKNDFFYEPLEAIYKYWKDVEYDDSFMFYRNRVSMWRCVKEVMGKDYYPHFMRHISVTNDTKAGISPSILKSKFGWTDLRPHAVYSHLNWFDIQSAQESAYGGAVIEPEITKVTVPEDYPGERAQMQELTKKIETASWKNEKITPREFSSVQEAMKNDLRTGDVINGKIAVVCSSQKEAEQCKNSLDGNKFMVVYTYSPERVNKLKEHFYKSGKLEKHLIERKKAAGTLTKAVKSDPLGVV